MLKVAWLWAEKQTQRTAGVRSYDRGMIAHTATDRGHAVQAAVERQGSQTNMIQPTRIDMQHTFTHGQIHNPRAQKSIYILHHEKILWPLLLF